MQFIVLHTRCWRAGTTQSRIFLTETGAELILAGAGAKFVLAGAGAELFLAGAGAELLGRPRLQLFD